MISSSSNAFTALSYAPSVVVDISFSSSKAVSEKEIPSCFISSANSTIFSAWSPTRSMSLTVLSKEVTISLSLSLRCSIHKSIRYLEILSQSLSMTNSLCFTSAIFSSSWSESVESAKERFSLAIRPMRMVSSFAPSTATEGVDIIRLSRCTSSASSLFVSTALRPFTFMANLMI